MELILKKTSHVTYAIFNQAGIPISSDQQFKNDQAAVDWGLNFVTSFQGVSLTVELFDTVQKLDKNLK